MILALLLALAQDPPPKKEKPPLPVEKRTVKEALDLVRPEAAVWSPAAALLRVTCKSSAALDSEPASGRYTDIEFLFGTRDKCRPGEITTKLWAFGGSQPVLRTFDPKTLVTAAPPVPEKVVDVKTIFEQIRAAGARLDRPSFEVAVVAGRPTWYTLNQGQEIFLFDAVSGEFINKGQGTLPPLARGSIGASTSWKQAVESVTKDLAGWRSSTPQILSLRAMGRNRFQVDKELSITEWTFSIFVEKPFPGVLYYQVSNGAVALWAQEPVPADRAHATTFSSWALAGAGAKVLENGVVKKFLELAPKVDVEISATAAQLKSGELVYAITKQETREKLEVLLDRKGNVKGAAK